MKLLMPLFFAVLGGPALALSCAPYSPEQAFLDAQVSPDPYIVVAGVLDFSPTDLPQPDPSDPNVVPESTQFTAAVTGFSLTNDGFNARFVRNIRVHVQCLGPWCGIVQPGESYLTFLKQTETGFLLETTPCQGFAFINPDKAMLDSMRTCFLGEACGAD